MDVLRSVLQKFKSIVRSSLRRITFSHADRQQALHMAWGHIFNNKLRGDYWEFGVYRGDSMELSVRELKKFKAWNMSQLKSSEEWRANLAKQYSDYSPKFLGFDTFEGMPENNEGNHNFQKLSFVSNLETVKKRLIKSIQQSNLILIKGDFTLLAGENISKQSNLISVVNIDCDLYESSLAALRLCRPFLQIGSVILFDEFHGFNADPTKGERKALADFLSETSIKVDRWFDYHYGGRSFLVTSI